MIKLADMSLRWGVCSFLTDTFLVWRYGDLPDVQLASRLTDFSDRGVVDLLSCLSVLPGDVG